MTNQFLSLLLGLAVLAGSAANGADTGASPYVPGARARVVVVEDADTIVNLKIEREAVHRLVDEGITAWTGQSPAARAWQAVVNTNQVIGLKVYSAPGRVSGTRPAVIEGIIEGLLAAGLPATNIIIWDRRLADLGAAGYFDVAERYGVRIAGAMTSGWDEQNYYDNPLVGKLVWGDLDFGRQTATAGRYSYVTRLVTEEMDRIIVVSPMLNHNEARVAGCLFSLANGSVDNFLRFEGDAFRLEIAVPEICALAAVGDKVALYIVDALIAQYEGGQRSLLHYSWPLRELRFSRDPVALDLLSAHEMSELRRAPLPDNVRTNFTLFNNAALVGLGIADTNRIDVERAVPRKAR